MDTQSIETESEANTSPEEIASRWKTELSLAAKGNETWEKRGDDIVKRYRDKRGMGGELARSEDSRYNIFWSNVQTQLPALYARTPRPQVERRFKDKDSLGRLSSLVLERATEFQVKDFDFDQVMVSVVMDFLLVGRGLARIRYLPYFETKVDEFGEVFEAISREEARAEYVFWKDFRHSQARCWDDVTWVAFRSYLTRDDLVQRFGKEVWGEVPLNYAPSTLDNSWDDDKKEMFKKAEIWEVWSKVDKKVYWVSTGFERPLDIKDDPMGLKDFFPCPRPLYATMTNDCLEPVPDFIQYQDQAMELDVITSRIVVITEALRVAGVYDGSCESLQRLLTSGSGNKLYPESNWAGLVQQGGLEGAIYFMPIAPLVEVLRRLYEARDQVLNTIYQVTGLSDIIRGATNPNETATAQQLKGQFGTLRIATRQAEVQRFAKDAIALMAEVIAEHFTPDTIWKTSGYEFMVGTMPEDPTEFDAIVGLLRDDPQRTFRIEIETDSTIAINEQADQQSKTEYLNAVGAFMQSMGPLVQNLPEFAPMVGEMLRLTSRSFKAGRTLEGVLENCLAKMDERLNAPPAEVPPDPKMIEAQTKQQLAEMKMALDEQKLIHKQQMDEYKAQTRQMMEMQKLEAKVVAEQQKTEMTGQMQLEKIRAEMAVKSMELAEKTKLDTINALKSESVPAPSPAPAASPVPIDITVSLAQPRRKVILGAPDEMGNRIGEIVDTPVVTDVQEGTI